MMQQLSCRAVLSAATRLIQADEDGKVLHNITFIITFLTCPAAACPWITSQKEAP